MLVEQLASVSTHATTTSRTASLTISNFSK